MQKLLRASICAVLLLVVMGWLIARASRRPESAGTMPSNGQYNSDKAIGSSSSQGKSRSEELGTINGLVVGKSDGMAVGGALVICRRSFTENGVECFSEVARAIANSQGGFVFPNLESEHYAVYAESEDGTLVCESPARVSFTEEYRSAQVTLELVGGRVVEGLVSTSDTHERLRGVRIEASSHSRSGYSTMSNDNGWYKFLLPEGHKFVIRCHQPERCLVEAGMRFRTAEADLVQPGQEPLRRDFDFLRGGRVHGTVCGTDGNVVQNALVKLTGNGTVLTASTTNQGVYEVYACDVASEYEIAVTATGYLAFTDRVALEGEYNRVKDIVLLMVGKDSAVLGGVVRTQSGPPLASARVKLDVHSSDEIIFRSECQTTEAGRFEFSDLPVGLAILHVTDAEGRDRAIVKGEDSQRGSFSVQMKAGETFDVEVITADLTGSLKGRVTNSLGTPVPGARVLAESAGSKMQAETTTDDHGRFNIGELPMYPLKLVVTATGFGTAIRNDIYPSSDDVIVQLLSPTSLTLRIADARTHETLPGVNVTVARGPGRLRERETRADGSLFYADVDPGRYLLWISDFLHPGKYADCRAIVEAPPEQHVEKEIELQPGCVVSGTVQYNTVPPTPVREGWAHLYDQQSPDVYYNVELDGNGHFEKTLLPAKYLLQVHNKGAVLPKFEMTVPSQASAAFMFSVPVANGGISINVVRGSNREGVQFHLLLHQGDSLDAPIGETFDIQSLPDQERAGVLQVFEISNGGRFELTNLVPGEYGVTIIEYDYNSMQILGQSTQRCTVTEGENIELEFQCP